MPITISSIWSLIVCLVGLVLFFSSNGKWSEAGWVMFAMGLLATLLSMGTKRLVFGG